VDVAAIRVGLLVGLLAGLLAGLGLALAARALGRRRAARGRSQQARQQGRIAVEGERVGATLLRAAGYQVLAQQVSHQVTVLVDDEAYAARLRCDYLVERAGVRWVAEIKTGVTAPSLTHPATRRQLLEYQVAYGVTGVVLVDATVGTVHEVRFELDPDGGAGRAETTKPPAMGWHFLVGVSVGAALVGVATRWL